MFIKFFLIVALIPLQACSNTLIGEKLENSFEIIENPIISKNTSKVKVQNKPKEIQKIKSSKKDEKKDSEKFQENIIKNNSMSNKERLSQNLIISKKKIIFKPQPYRIILKLSGANPSAPAETVTAALRKAGIEFEVEKIERFDEKNLLKDSTLKRYEF